MTKTAFKYFMVLAASISAAGYSLDLAAQATRDLIVEPGQEVQLAARLHQFSNVHIKPGGRVVVAPRSSRWSIWWVSGDVIIEGEVIGKDFSRSANPIEDRTPDGKTMSHQFENSAEGGAGGSGGAAAVAGAGSRQGGSGARGTTEFGGGGGSPGGIHIEGPATRLGSPGVSAADWRGAEPATDGGYSRRGGDGTRIARHPNGALLLIYTQQKFSGNGVFELSGHHGTVGQQGSSGYSSNRGHVQGGGGGGGAPGGDGGRLVIVAAELDNRTHFNASGGVGGPGGPAGRPILGATPGTKGDDGSSGFIDEIPLDQWFLMQELP